MEETVTLDSGLNVTKYEYENLMKEQKRLSAKLYRTQRKLGEIIPTRGGRELHIKVKEMGREVKGRVCSSVQTTCLYHKTPWCRIR